MRLHPAAWVTIMTTLVASGYAVGTAVKEQYAGSMIGGGPAGAAGVTEAPIVPEPSFGAPRTGPQWPPDGMPGQPQPPGSPGLPLLPMPPAPPPGEPPAPVAPAVPVAPAMPVPPAPGEDGTSAGDSGTSGPDGAAGSANGGLGTDADTDADPDTGDGRTGRDGRTSRGRRTVLHLPLNTAPDQRARAASLGYDLFDVGPGIAELDALPRGSRALVWTGDGSCADLSRSYPSFTAAVRRLAADPRVYGWYLADEPDPSQCPGIAAELRKRADYLHRHAPRQRSFALLAGWSLEALRPSVTHLDLIGLDPYPCRIGNARCDLEAIDRTYRRARRAGIRPSMMVPVIQAFGQTCTTGRSRNWRLPEPAELRAVLRRWGRLTPGAPFDISYSWGRQQRWACPALMDADGTGGHPDLQAVMKKHNRAP